MAVILHTALHSTDKYGNGDKMNIHCLIDICINLPCVCVCLSVCLSVFLSVCVCVCVCLCLSVCPENLMHSSSGWN